MFEIVITDILRVMLRIVCRRKVLERYMCYEINALC